MVTEIAAHEDECGRRGGCTGETGEMTCCMAGSIEEVKGPIAKEVECFEWADLERFLVKVDLSKVSSPKNCECLANGHCKMMLTYNRPPEWESWDFLGILGSKLP